MAFRRTAPSRAMAPKATGGSAAGGMSFSVRAPTEAPVADLSVAEDSGRRELDRSLVTELVEKIKLIENGDQ
eukprot:11204391-Alexandrium_andersonii.AAC.1